MNQIFDEVEFVNDMENLMILLDKVLMINYYMLILPDPLTVKAQVLLSNLNEL
jgi:hypothetical protein